MLGNNMPLLKPSAPKKAKKARMKTEMKKFSEGKLHSGSKKGPLVTNPKQAIAISLSESGQSKYGKKNKKRGKMARKARAALKSKK